MNYVKVVLSTCFDPLGRTVCKRGKGGRNQSIHNSFLGENSVHKALAKGGGGVIVKNLASHNYDRRHTLQ